MNNTSAFSDAQKVVWRCNFHDTVAYQRKCPFESPRCKFEISSFHFDEEFFGVKPLTVWLCDSCNSDFPSWSAAMKHHKTCEKFLQGRLVS